MKRIPDKSINLIITDPPYLHVKGGMKSAKFNVGKMKEDSFINTEMNDFGEKEIDTFLSETKRLFKISYNGYFFCSKLQIPYYLSFALKNKLKFDVLIWDRLKNSMISCKFYASNIDYIIRIYGDKQALNDVGNVEDKVACYQKIKKYKQGIVTNHPTEKPLKLIAELILLSSKQDEVVLDPFIGSGTLAVAAIKTNRTYIGYEKDLTIYNLANSRIESCFKEVI